MIRILTGDVREKLAELPDESVHCVVTSPPYWGLRDYGVLGQLGMEPTLGEHIETMVSVFREVRRVLRKDGTVWLNYGDCYAGGGKGGNPPDSPWAGFVGNKQREQTAMSQGKKEIPDGLKPKDLCMIPNRLAIALQDDGWWVRSEIIWHKPNPMPESVTDRPATAHEKIWLLTRSARYWYDAEAVRTESKCEPGLTGGAYASPGQPPHAKARKTDKQRGHSPRHAGFNDRWDAMTKEEQQGNGANLRNVWTVTTKGFSEAHFATFPPDLIIPCIKAGTSEKGCCAKCGAPWVRETRDMGYTKHRPSAGNDPRSRSEDKQAKGSLSGHHGWKGNNLLKNTPETIGWSPSCKCNADVVPCTVMDPFGGSGTTGMVADRLGRNAILIELNPDYAEMARKRIETDAGMFAEVL